MATRNRPGSAPSRTAKQSAVSRSQAIEGELADDYVPQEVDQGLAQAQAESFADMVLGREGMATAFSGLLAKTAGGADLQMAETYRRALEIIDQRSPGMAAQIVADAGSPEAFAVDFGGGQASEASQGQEAAKRKYNTLSPFENVATYGAGGRQRDPVTGKDIPGGRRLGLEELTREEDRSKNSRVGDASLPWQQRTLLFLGTPSGYHFARQNQIQSLVGKPLTREILESLRPGTREAASQLQLGAPLPGWLAEAVPREMADRIAGPVSIDSLTPEQAYQSRAANGNFGDMSSRDAKIATILRAAEERGSVPMDEILRWYRYQFPAPKGGEVVRPGWAPTGEFLARLSRGTFGLGDDIPDWVSLAAPVFDRSIREQAANYPKVELPRGGRGKTEFDFSQLILPPGRQFSHLLAAEKEGKMPFPMFMEGVPMNREDIRNKTPLNLGGLLLDGTESATPTPDPAQPPISTPEAMPQPDQPPVTPADDELGMYDQRMRRMDPNVLAALLA